MRTMLIMALMLLVTGCAQNVFHAKKCFDTTPGYQACHHVVEYWTEPACIGSCSIKK